MIVVEMDTFEEDLLPPSRCINPAALWLERALLRAIIHHEAIGDDAVVPDYVAVPWQIHLDEFGLQIPLEYGDDGEGGHLGYRWEHPIRDLSQDLHLLQPARYWVDREGTLAMKAFVEETVGDILPVVIENTSFGWHAAPSAKVVQLMGMERMLLAMIDEPEAMHALYAYLRNNILAYARWQEGEGLLTLNNCNHFVGAGSYGFTRELPRPGKVEMERIQTRDLWLNMNSQETVGISPRMYRELVFPTYRDIAQEFGLLYYGCCEPVHAIWESSISKLPNLRKVSISPWCDQNFMGEVLRGSSVIYSRKPSPNFIGVGGTFDAGAFRTHIQTTLNAAKGCTLEFIYRDVYTLSGDLSKPGQAVEIMRQCIAEI